MSATPLNRAWRKANPLPPIDAGHDKNSRGRLLVAGGSRLVPGGLRLTGEAALRIGAGKVKLATVASAAIALGIAMPECALLGLEEDAAGELGAGAGAEIAAQAAHCDALVLGPAMGGRSPMAALVRDALGSPRDELSVLLDAAALTCAAECREAIAAHSGRVVLTPHHGEMAALTGLDAQAIAADPEGVAADVARRFAAIVVLKHAGTVIATPDGTLLTHASDSVGLGTGGSGDVLAGVIGGLMARGAAPLVAAGWGVWLHSAAGNAAALHFGQTGFLARDLLGELPRLLSAHDY